MTKRIAWFLAAVLWATACGQAVPPPPPAAVVVAPTPEAPVAVTTTVEAATTTVAPDPLAQVKHFAVYRDDGHAANHYVSSGWMGDAGLIEGDAACGDKPFSGTTCMRWTYGAGQRDQGWAGVYWQEPAGNWKGEEKAGFSLVGARALKFAARGENGGEIVTFGFGGLKGKYGDTAKGELPDVRLGKDWAEYSIPIAAMDLSNIIGGFSWSASGQKNGGKPVVFYLDDIRYEY